MANKKILGRKKNGQFKVDPDRIVVDVAPIAIGKERERPAPTSKPFGAAVVQTLNNMQMATEAEVSALATDADAPISQRMAAKALLRANSDAVTTGGIPVAHVALDWCLDRTVGKSTQQIEVTQNRREQHVISLTEDSIARLEAFNATREAVEAD